MSMKRHMGRMKAQPHTRLVIALKQLPEDPNYALVINPDSLVKNVDRDEVLALVNSPEGQQEENFIDALYRKQLLTYFHKAGFLKKVHIDEIELTPSNTTTISLREVINQLNRARGLADMPSAPQNTAISTANPLAHDMQEELQQNNVKESMAKALLVQASMMDAEVRRKRNEAYAIAPHLRPVDVLVASPVVVEGIKEDIEFVNDATSLASTSRQSILNGGDPDAVDLTKKNIMAESVKKRRTRRRKRAAI